MMDEPILAAGLPPQQVALAVAAAMPFFTARRPSSRVGALQARLGTRDPPAAEPVAGTR